MRTQPSDLNEGLIAEALAQYSIRPATMEYLPVGFGSHHWRAIDEEGQSFFLTIDDLDAKRTGSDDTVDATFERLSSAFRAAKTLRDVAGFSFVVAPLAAQDGSLTQRLTDRYSLAAFPMLEAHAAGDDGEFTTDAERAAVLSLLIALHRVDRDVVPGVGPDDFVVPNRAELMEAMDDLAHPWNTGPYGEPARSLLAAHAADVAALLDVYDRLAANVSSEPDRMVITHGEPHAANVVISADEYYLVDWDTVLLAPPERDLCALGGGTEILDAYRAATGVAPRQEALELYQIWFDLSEISGYIQGFRVSHVDSADSAESWRNLAHFLRPRERWPAYI